MHPLKKIVLPLFFALFGIQAYASLPDGVNAPDWTLKDLEGREHNLYEILQSGRHVILQFAASWCTASWKYHRSGRLKAIWDMYGPKGTNEVMIFLIEADLKTNSKCLYGPKGCVGGTTGNWCAKTPFPVINLSGQSGMKILQDYRVSTFPEVYLIHAADKRVFNVGMLTVGGWQSWIHQSFKMYSMSKVEFDGLSDANTRIHIISFYGAGEKKYTWSNGQSGQKLPVKRSGSYLCRISDRNGYFIDTEIMLTDTDLITFEDTENQRNHWHHAVPSEGISGNESLNDHLNGYAGNESHQEDKFRLLNSHPQGSALQSAAFKMYPNPASRNIYVTVQHEDISFADVSIMDDTGKIYVFENLNGHDSINIDISGLLPGIYFLQVRNNNFVQVKKVFVIQ